MLPSLRGSSYTRFADRKVCRDEWQCSFPSSSKHLLQDANYSCRNSKQECFRVFIDGCYVEHTFREGKQSDSESDVQHLALEFLVFQQRDERKNGFSGLAGKMNGFHYFTSFSASAKYATTSLCVAAIPQRSHSMWIPL